MPRSRIYFILALGTLLASQAGAAKPKPPLCGPGTFVVAAAAERLLPDADPARSETIVIDEGGFVSVPPGCPAAPGKRKATRKGTKLRAKWAKATCEGLPKKVKLKAKFDASCDRLEGKLKSRKHKRPFVAERLPELKGFGGVPLSPVLEQGAALARVIGPEGGDAVAWGADGTHYRLRVPAGALPGPTGITLTPALAVDGLPLEGGLLAAVDLAPSGLAFASPATLTITPPEPLPGARLAGFGWSGDAHAFGIAPAWVAPDGASISVQVDHFSGFGAGIPGPSQLDAVAGELLAAELASAPIEAQLLTCLLPEAAPCTPAELEQILIAWFEQVVEPRIGAGGSGPVEALVGHRTLLRWRVEAEAHVEAHGSTDLELLLSLALGQNLLNLSDAAATYRPPACSGEVTDWIDWVRIPQELFLRASEVYSAQQTADMDPGFGGYCVALELRDASFPSTLEEQETELDLSFRTVVATPGGADEPVASNVDLAFGPGASGQTGLDTDADGSFATQVHRDPTADRVSVTAYAQVASVPILLASQRFVAGDTEFAFEDHVSGLPPAYVPSGETAAVCVLSRVGAPAGTVVDFELVEPPGSLEAASAPLQPGADEELRACVDYRAPDGPVGRDVAGVVRATMAFEGTTYDDVVEVFPHWIDVTVRADVGSGWQNATNTALAIPGEGPYALEGEVLQAGAHAGDPPLAWEGGLIGAFTDQITLQAGALGCCDTVAAAFTDADGRFPFSWRANGSPGPDFHIEVRAGDPSASFAGAGVTLSRAAWSLAASFPGVVEPGVDETLLLTVTDGDGGPVPSAWVEIDATGGTVLASSGTTDAQGMLETTARLAQGQTTLQLAIRVSAFPGGPVLASDTLQASSDGAPPFAIVERLDQVTTRMSITQTNTSPVTGLGQAYAGMNIVGQGNLEGSRGFAEHRSNVVATPTALQATFNGQGVATGIGFVVENVFRLVFDVTTTGTPYRVFGGTTFEGDGQPDAEVVAALRREDGSEVACLGLGVSCPIQTEVSGELEPGRYVFETNMNFRLGTATFEGGFSVGVEPTP